MTFVLFFYIITVAFAATKTTKNYLEGTVKVEIEAISADSFSFTVTQTGGTGNMLALGFPDNVGSMGPADIVIGFNSKQVGDYKTTGFSKPTAADAVSTEKSFDVVDGNAVMKFVRKSDPKLTGKTSVPVNVAIGGSAAVVQHASGTANRQSQMMDLPKFEASNNVDCVTEAPEWSTIACGDKTCGTTGTKERTITIKTAAQGTGKACPTVLKETQSCENPECQDEDCVPTAYPEWSTIECPAACNENGIKKRTREVAEPKKGDGKDCVLSEEQPCTGECDKDDVCKTCKNGCTKPTANAVCGDDGVW